MTTVDTALAANVASDVHETVLLLECTGNRPVGAGKNHYRSGIAKHFTCIGNSAIPKKFSQISQAYYDISTSVQDEIVAVARTISAMISSPFANISMLAQW